MRLLALLLVVIDSGWVAVSDAESVTWTVKSEVPVVSDGVPEMTPEPEFRDAQSGSDPAVIVHVYPASLPPEAVSVWE